MARATIADIAEKAGVSPATVDRALNGRKGVSASNRQRVMRAARDLGYVPSEGMVVLPARPARLQFLLPLGRNAFMHDLAAGIRSYAATQPLVETCDVIALDGIGPEAFEAGLDALAPDTRGVGVLATDHPRSRDAIRRLCEAGLRVVTLASDVLSTPRSAYVGVDNYVAGRTAAQILGMLAGGRAGAVAVFVGSRDFHGHREREDGFHACLRERHPDLRPLPPVETGEDRDRVRRAMTRLLRVQDDLRAVYCVGAGRTGIVEALAEGAEARRPHVVLHDLTDNSRAWLAADRVDAVIDQNAQLVGEQAVLRLLGAIAAGPAPLPLHYIDPRIILRENIPAGRPAP